MHAPAADDPYFIGEANDWRKVMRIVMRITATAFALLTASALTAVAEESVGAQVKEAARETGEAIKDTAKTVGKKTKAAAKTVGRTAKDTAKTQSAKRQKKRGETPRLRSRI
jgi:hypothetical protein